MQREQWNTVMNNLKPYAEVGLPEKLMMTLEGQNKAANDFFGSGLYKTQADQARYQNLVSAEATGGLAQQLPVTSYLPLRPCFITIGLVGKCKIMETC